MRCSISTVAVAASSLLVKEVFAGRYDVRKRDTVVVTDAVIVTEEVTVYDYGTSTSTGEALAVATFTSDGVPVVIAAASSTPISSTTEAPAVLIQQTPTSSTPTPAPKPTTSTTPVPVVVPTTTEAPVVAPTTLVAVVSSAAKVVSAAAPIATSSSSTTSSSAKRGLAYNDVSLLSGFESSKSISWAYDWGSSSDGTIPSAFEFVPLLWGLASSFTSGWNAAATAAIAAGSTHLMCFNEPDLSSQSNISPADAAAGFLQYMQPFAGKAQLGAPAVTNGGSPMGLTWLGNFLDACTDCQIDFVCIHWYNGGDADAFMDYVDQAYTAGGNRPLWITEFQGEGDATAQNSFLETVIPQLDASPKVARYAYFMASDGNLLSSGTSLSALGTTFAFTD
ncbi:glycoside hydrolase family 128 protein [Hyaloscypha variabilis]